jgi:ABC-type transporter Mla MlaB component
VRRDSVHGTSLAVTGRLVLGYGARWLTWAPLVDSIVRGPIRLDLAGVTDLDAAGLGVLARLARRARFRGHPLAVVSASPRVRRMLVLTRLDMPLGSPLDGAVDFSQSRSTYR